MKRQRLLWVMAALLAMVQAHASGGELIVFTGNPKDAVTKDFKEKTLPRIKELAKAQGIAVVEKNITKGVPEEVTFTPSMYFQNHLGRSLYIGRYQATDKLKTFLRTVSRIPQSTAPNEKHHVLVWKQDRATVVLPIKVTALDGMVPDGHDANAFHQEALQALARGASRFKLEAAYQAQRTDRAMYLALYPYHGADGKLFVSAEMYSQFNCVEPIFRRFEHPFAGTWKNWKAVFEEAGKILQDEVVRQLGSTAKGDGMIPIPASTPTRSWEDLGLALPKAPATLTQGNLPAIHLGTRWELEGPTESGASMLNFSFMAPVDHYAGEVKTLFGSLELSAGPSLRDARGRFGIETQSLTLGDSGLDAHVHEMIGILDHPRAFFSFERMVSMENPSLAFGTVTQFTVQGSLEFMGIKLPLAVTAQMEPILDENAAPRVAVTAAFSLRLKENYGLEGPDGPLPAADTMQFLLNFLLKPTA